MMPLFPVISLLAMLTINDLAYAKISQEKYRSSGYEAYADFVLDGCEHFYGSQLSVGAYADKVNFRTTGKYGYMETTDYQWLNLWFSKSTCDESTVTFQEGYAFDYYEDYFEAIPVKFTVETKKLTEASLQGLEVPVYERTCSYYCNEICYAEIFEYGTCPADEEPTVECYISECTEPETPMGIATVAVYWKVLPGTTSSTEQGSYKWHYSGVNYMSMSRSKGSYRYEIPVSLTAKLNNIDLFSGSSFQYSNGALGSTTSTTLTKAKFN